MPRSSVSPLEPALPSGAAAREFCVVCGATGLPLVEGVCARCYADRNPLVSTAPQATVVLCAQCGARQIGRHWERRGSTQSLGAEDLLPFLVPHAEAAIRRVRWSEVTPNPMLRRLRGEASVCFRGLERTIPVELTVRVVHRTCPDCSRRSGHFYTAVVQIRGPAEGSPLPAREMRERLAQVWETILAQARPDWREQHSWSERRPEGWDHFFVDTLAARAIAHRFRDRFGAEVKESASLYGRREGRDLYRVTFAVRLPAYLPGEYYVADGELFRLDRTAPKAGFEMTAVRDGRTARWPSATLERARWLGGRNRIRRVRSRREGSGRTAGVHPDSGAWVILGSAPETVSGSEVDVLVDGDRLWYAGSTARGTPLER